MNTGSRRFSVKYTAVVERSYIKRETRGLTPGLGQHFSAIMVTPTCSLITQPLPHGAHQTTCYNRPMTHLVCIVLGLRIMCLSQGGSCSYRHTCATPVVHSRN